MIALIFATNREAQPFLQRAGLDTPASCDKTVFDLRPGKQIVVCICGMGPHDALNNTRCILGEHQIDSVINAGIAGALSGGRKAGDVFRITSTLAWDKNSGTHQIDSDLFMHLSPASLATVEEPVFDSKRRREIAAIADLVDMEGAYIAQACREKDIPFRAIKGVSDFAGEEDRKTLCDNLDIASAIIAETLWKELKHG